MFKIINAELKYSRYWLVKVFLFIPPLLLYFYLFDRWWLNGIIVFVGLLIVVMNIKIRFLESRLRLETILPISNKTQSITRLLLSTFPVLFVYGICELFSLLPSVVWDNWRDSSTERLMFLSVTFYLIFVFHLMTDVMSGWISIQNKKVYEIIKSVIVGIILIIVAGTLSTIYNRSEENGILAIKLVFLLDIVLAWISLRTFEKRKSFIT